MASRLRRSVPRPKKWSGYATVLSQQLGSLWQSGILGAFSLVFNFFGTTIEYPTTFTPYRY